MNIWAEKHRPKTLEDYVFPTDEVRLFVESIMDTGELPNLLLSGVQGTGKTTLARVLVNELESIDPADIMTINASRERGIDTIREKVSGWVTKYPMGSHRVVILEEADGLTPQAQEALRADMENYMDTARFILTCNFPHKVIDPLKSRCQRINIKSFDKELLAERAATILDAEGVTVPDIDSLLQHVDAFAPDLRAIIQSIQQSSVTGTLVGVTSQGSGEGMSAWEEEWRTNPTKEGLLPLTNSIDATNYEAFYTTMYENVTQLPEGTREVAVVLIAEHLYRAATVSNQTINLASCVYQIFGQE